MTVADTLPMRHFIRIVEAIVPETMRQQTFYHGTPDDENGRSILENGIMPGNVGGESRGHLTPVVGRSYLTSSLRYGIIYCIGGDMLGAQNVEYLVNKTNRAGRASRYGWLFVINGDTLADDVQPDEDSVGAAAMYANTILNKPDRGQYYSNEPLYQGLMNADPQRLRWFLHNAKSSMTPRQWEGTLDGFISAQASGGKRFLRRMNDADKLFLIRCGAHVAYQGAIVPDQAWRFDKMMTPQLEKDGGNFWQLAERVR